MKEINLKKCCDCDIYPSISFDKKFHLFSTFIEIHYICAGCAKNFSGAARIPDKKYDEYLEILIQKAKEKWNSANE